MRRGHRQGGGTTANGGPSITRLAGTVQRPEAPPTETSLQGKRKFPLTRIGWRDSFRVCCSLSQENRCRTPRKSPRSPATHRRSHTRSTPALLSLSRIATPTRRLPGMHFLSLDSYVLPKHLLTDPTVVLRQPM